MPERQRPRMRMIRPEQGPVADGEEHRAREAAEEANARFIEAMRATGREPSAPIVDNSPLCPTKFHPEPTRLGDSSMAGI